MRNICTIILVLLTSIAFGQKGVEDDLLKKADKLFEEGQFLTALPEYRQLVSISPDNKQYNFKYGACLLSSEEDVDEAVKHLSYACSGGLDDVRSHFYLGKAYHLNYQFVDALNAYNKFKSEADSKTQSAFREVDRLITMADNGKALMSDIKDITVLDKTESTAGEFFRNYDLSAMGGSIIKVPEELLTSNDKKKGHSPLMFFPTGGGEIIFSSYGRSGNQLELFTVQRLGDGGFTNPTKLSGVINSPYDEDYPFLHADGRTLYFSSKGHNSMGGYDVFRSKRNLSTGIFEAPVNLDFAISTPDDDLFYVVDPEKRIANFASTRGSEDGRLHVYKVAVSTATLEMAIVQGKVTNFTGESSASQIKVYDATTNEELGVYRTDQEGNYLIDLPGTGKYKFFIDAEESDVLHTGIVDVPSFGKLRAFEQEMELQDLGGQEKLIIKNHFDKEPEGDVLALAREIIKRKALLDVNYDGEDLTAEAEEPKPYSESEAVIRSGFGEEISLDEVLSMSNTQIAQLETRLEAESIERDKAFSRADQKTKASQAAMRKASELYDQLQATADPEAEAELIVSTSLARAEAEQLASEAAIALTLAKELNQTISDNQTLLDELKLRESEIALARESSDLDKLIPLLKDVKTKDDKGIVQVDALETTTSRAQDAAKESNQVLNRMEQLQGDRSRVMASIKTKETQLSNTTKRKEVEILEAELESLRAELNDVERQQAVGKSRLKESQTITKNTEGAVVLLEQIRLGQEIDVMELQPMAIPSRGLENTGIAIAQVYETGEAMAIRENELEQILSRRPELLARLSGDQRMLLQDFASVSDYNFPSSETNTSSAATMASENPLTDTSSSQTEPGEIDVPNSGQDEISETDADSSTGNSIERPEAAIDNPEAGSIADTPSPETNLGNPDSQSASIEEALAEPDYSQMSLDQLLNELQADYSSARAEVDASEMPEVDRAQAIVDLNQAAILKIEQRVELEQYSSDYEQNEQKQANVAAMEQLVKELDAEMLAVASSTVSASGPSPQVLDSEDIGRLASQSGMQEVVVNHFNQMESLDADPERTEIVKLTTRVKSQVAFVQELNQAMQVDREDQDPIAAAQEKAALNELNNFESSSLQRDIDGWQREAGVRLTPGEITLAKNVPSYLTERTILESSFDQEGILNLNTKTAQSIISDPSAKRNFPNLTDPQLNVLSDLVTEIAEEQAGVLPDSGTSENTAGQTAASETSETETLASESASEEAEADSAPQLTARNQELEVLTKSKNWTAELFDERASQKKALQLRQELVDLENRNLMDREKAIDQESDIVDKFRTPIVLELAWKQELIKVAARKNETPAAVQELLQEGSQYEMRASQLREAISLYYYTPTERSNITNQTLLLELAALDKMEEALALEKHLAKGKSEDSFRYNSSIPIDDQKLMTETAQYLEAQNQSLAADSSTEKSIDAGAETGDTESITEASTALLSQTESAAVEISSAETPEPSTNQEAVETGEQNTAAETVSVPNQMPTGTASLISTEAITDEQLGVITNTDELADLPALTTQEAVVLYPETKSELRSKQVLPILSFEQEMSLMTPQQEPSDITELNQLSDLSTAELDQLKRQGIQLDTYKRYEKELIKSTEEYNAERSKRVVRMAEVIDLRAQGDSPELRTEQVKLAKEIRVIDAYLTQAELNMAKTKEEIAAVTSEREGILAKSAFTGGAVASESEGSSTSEFGSNSPSETNEDGTSEPESTAVLESAESSPAESTALPNPNTATASIPDEYPSFSSPIAIPDVLEENLFRVNDSAGTRSIPMNVELPAGTIYQVQVGAFRKPIPEALFREFDPIMGTQLDNGITRYKVGLFTTENSAVAARDAIRDLGYRDAFVVKYVNGSRDGIVTSPSVIAEAQDASDSSQYATETTSNQSSTASQSGGSNTGDTGSDSSSSQSQDTEKDPSAYYNSVVDAAPATQVEVLDGLFYTVQVGVYSKPVTSSAIFDITPLNSERLSSGKVKYTSGIFDDVLVAEQWKTKIREKGVSDAFVTAYHNGKRVTLDQAALIRSSQGDDVLINMDELNARDVDRQGQAVWEMVSTEELFNEQMLDQIQFKIRMGPYYERIPDRDVKVILDFENQIEYGQNPDGSIYYLTKGNMSYKEAQKWRAEFKTLGISDANIIALKEGEEISVKQALDFLLK